MTIYEDAVNAATTSEEATALAVEFERCAALARARVTHLYVRGCRLRTIERAKDPAVSAFLLDLAIRERETPGSLGTNGVWQAKLHSVLGKVGTIELSHAGFTRELGDVVLFFDTWLEQLARGQFDLDVPFPPDGWEYAHPDWRGVTPGWVQKPAGTERCENEPIATEV